MGLPVLSTRSWPAVWAPMALALVGHACGSPPPTDKLVQRPNVLLILVDDLRPDLGSYGHPQVRSPQIDRLAAQGVRFEHAYAQYPACNPSRTSLLTGLRPDTTRVFDNQTPFPSRLPEAITLPQLFHDQGYFTASIGKVFHGSGHGGRATAPQAWDLQAFPRSARQGRQDTAEPLPRGRVARYKWRATPDGFVGLKDHRTASRAIEVLREVRDRSFFLAVGFTATHPHFVAPAKFFDLYPLASITPPSSTEGDLVSQLTELQGWSDEGSRAFSEQKKKELIRAYWACVSFADAQVGRLLDAVERLDLSGNTIVALASDHGYHLGEQGWWSKRTLYEASTRVPFIIQAPGLEAAAGESSPRLVELVDLYPTLAELAGLDPPPTLEGQSLVPLLEDPQRDWRPAAFSQLSLGQIEGRSVRTERWRYTEWDAGRRRVELFDLAAEATESVNMADDPEHEDVRRRLSALLQ